MRRVWKRVSYKGPHPEQSRDPVDCKIKKKDIKDFEDRRFEAVRRMGAIHIFMDVFKVDIFDVPTSLDPKSLVLDDIPDTDLDVRIMLDASLDPFSVHSPCFL